MRLAFTSAAIQLAISATFPLLSGSTWSGWGGNIFNNRWTSQDLAISSANFASSLKLHCHLNYGFRVSAAPTISSSERLAFYPAWNGLFIALDYETCRVRWQINVTSIITSHAPLSETQKAILPVVSRTSPQIDGDILYFGTSAHALVVAINLRTGKVLGTVQINSHPLAMVTMSPTVYNGQIFVGASSLEEVAATNPEYPCCTFAGNFVALKFDRRSSSFKVGWNISMLPADVGPGRWSGAAVWGSQPSIDPVRRQVFIGTGNTYEAPEEFSKCMDATRPNATKDMCLPPRVWQDSVLAIDIEKGEVNWVRRLSPLDAWTLACGAPEFGPRNTELCPFTPGPDADFGMAPTFVPAVPGISPNRDDVVVIGQKNGNLYSLRAVDGKILWTTVTSPGGIEGGLSWGIAADNERVFFTAMNTLHLDWEIQPSKKRINNSAYGAASLSNGKLLWETQTPHNATAYSPPTIAGDLLFVGRNTTKEVGGGLVVLKKKTGEILGEFATDTTLRGGIAIHDQYIMFGTGYSGLSVRVTPRGSFYVLKAGN